MKHIKNHKHYNWMSLIIDALIFAMSHFLIYHSMALYEKIGDIKGYTVLFVFLFTTATYGFALICLFTSFIAIFKFIDDCNKVKKIELKPCPKCGGEGEIINVFGIYSAHCKDCGLELGADHIRKDYTVRDWNEREE